jgi:hypothetical protein
MSAKQKFFVVITLVLLAFIIVKAQQQQSGGSGGGNVNVTQVGSASVTLGSKTSANSIPVVIASDNAAQAVSESGTWNVGLNTGSNVIGKVSIDQTTPGTTNLVQIGGSLPAGAATIGTVNIAAAQAVGLNAGTNLIGKVVPLTSCGTTAFSQAWAAVPQANTAVTASTTCVQAIMFTNTNASAQTVTVTDNQGSPVTVIATYSIPGNSQVTFPFNFAPFTSGIKWSAGGAGVTGSITGIQ